MNIFSSQDKSIFKFFDASVSASKNTVNKCFLRTFKFEICIIHDSNIKHKTQNLILPFFSGALFMHFLQK